MKEIGEENIKKWIYVLKKSELESYFLNSKILSKWFNVPEDEIIETLNEIEENNDYKKLNKIFQKYGGSYKKSRDTKDFAETFSNEDMDPEIKRLFEMLISKSNP